MNKTVYITGAAGLLGSDLIRLFLLKGWQVKGCDNLMGGLESNLEKYLPYIDYKTFDIRDYDQLKNHMEGSNLVLHCAALAYEGLSVFSPKTITENIVGGTLSVASSCISNNVEKLINFSSMARYGSQTPPFTENLPRKPVDPYGLAKVQAEEQLELLSDLHSLNFLTVVPHNVIGIGQRFIDPFRNVVAIMINRILQKKPVVIYGDGTQKRSFSNVMDCSDTIYRLAISDRDLIKQIYNIGPDDNEITINELAHKIGEFCGVFPEIQYYPDRPAEVKNAWCSSEKIRNDFNYNTARSMDQTIKEMVNWISSIGPKPFNYDILPIEIINDKTPKTWTERLI